MKSLSRDEVRAIDRCAIEQVGVAGVVLMENAGRQAADAAAELLGDPPAGKSAAIVCSAGNNGGDGFVIARHLEMRGVRTATFLVTPAEKISGDAAENLQIIRKLGQDIQAVGADEIGALGERLGQFDIVVDAVGGTGISGPLRGSLAAAVEQINASGRAVLAVDIPTGLDCDSGAADGPAVRAAMTVTFVARKLGFDAPGAAEYTGEVRVADIGIPADIAARINPNPKTKH